MAGSSTQVVEPPAEYDVTITSYGHTEAELQAAIDGTHTAEEAETPAEEAAAETPVEEPETPAVPAPVSAPVADESYEEPAADETPVAASARIERNVKRIIALNTKLANRDQHLDTLQAKNARLEAELAALRAGKPVAAEPTAPEPPAPVKFQFQTWDDYQAANPESSHEDYIDARTDARMSYNRQVEHDRAVHNAAVGATRKLLADSKTHIESFRAAHPDFDAVLSASAAPLPAPMHQAMLKSGEMGPVLAYHLAKPENLEEAERIAALEPIDQVREIGALAVTLKSGGTPPAVKPVAPAKKTTKAPEPLAVVPGSAISAKDPATMGTDEFLQWYDADQKRRGKR